MCMQQLYWKLQDFKQESKSVQEYTESFYRLQSRCNLPKNEKVCIRRYMHGLREDIRYNLVYVWINTLEEAYSFASHVQANCPKKPVLTTDMEMSQLEMKEELQGYTFEGILTPADTSISLIAHRMVDTLGLTTMAPLDSIVSELFIVHGSKPIVFLRVDVSLHYVISHCESCQLSHHIVLAKSGNDVYLPPHRHSDWRSKETFNSLELSSSSGGV
ncbi:hypothetical protein IFM89_031012 [Coptis chinensis]|uniref:Retrotransposon gag domain-containing protein n=1 Tax=Coptis chinensis TaxID=261450 RepID=A0A835H6F6_9MAGN|nr:hypothetical protein IFM89_031012 [Coptis chinensis]